MKNYPPATKKPTQTLFLWDNSEFILHYLIPKPMNTPHRNLATPRLNSSQPTPYFSTLIICLVNRGFLAFIAFITIVEKKYSTFKTISSTLPFIAPLYRKIFPYTAKLATLTPKKFKHLSLIIKAFLSFQATKVISVGNKKIQQLQQRIRDYKPISCHYSHSPLLRNNTEE